jgi:hypothetical protein
MLTKAGGRMRQLISAALAALAAGAAYAKTPSTVDLGFLKGEWTIFDGKGAAVGSATIVVQWPDAILYEQRKIGDRNTQPLWFVNSEKQGGWQQLFVGINGRVREFDQESTNADWPLVLNGDVVLHDGTPARFRMTLWRGDDNESRRRLEESVDDGATWTTVFDYTYRRKASGVPSDGTQ